MKNSTSIAPNQALLAILLAALRLSLTRGL
jgi:hypothetical protein